MSRRSRSSKPKWANSANERWRPVAGTGGLYMVSNYGRVRSLHFGKVRTLRLRPSKVGYHRVTLSVCGVQRQAYVHHLVAEAFLGPRPADAPHIRHLDGDRSYSHVNNLAYGTVAENMQDRVRHGNDANGRKTHCPKGHELPPFRPGGKRVCRTCASIRARIRYQNRKAATA